MYKTKIICELGINHNGSVKVAKKLIDVAIASNCWGVKFQYRSLINKNKKDEIGKEIINLEVKRNYLKPSDINSLAEYSEKKGLKVGISFFSRIDFFDFKNLDRFDFLKVPSSVSNDFDLLKFFFSKKKKIFISTGGKTSNEIDKIIKFLNRYKVKEYSIFHCVSNYPLFNENAKLGYIDTLKKRYPRLEFGYSSHENNIFNCIYVLSKKISYLERHVTLDKNGKGLDHSSSSDAKEIFELSNFNNKIDIIDKKQKSRDLNQGEVINIQNLGYSYYFKKLKKKNSILQKDDLYLDTPKLGVDSQSLPNFIGKKILENAEKDSPLLSSLFKKNLVKKNNIKFAQKNLISFPIREKDYEIIHENLKSNCYEFHFTFQDLIKFNLENFDRNFLKKNLFSIHLPDYIDQNNLIDFFSKDKKIKNKSFLILENCLKISKDLSFINKKNCNLIVSIPNHQNLDKKTFYLNIKQLIENVRKTHGVDLLPQWLPPIAWYFGGSYYTSAFSNPFDFIFLQKMKIKICLDTSHFILSCNYYNKDPDLIFVKNVNLFKHFHIGDAKGFDFEGILLGNGDMEKTKLLRKIFKLRTKIKVLETWQGHLNNCDFFKKDLIYLSKLFNK